MPKTESPPSSYIPPPITKENIAELNKEECSICYDSLFLPEEHAKNHYAIELNKCHHRFHLNCIDDYFGNTKVGKKTLCPICTANVNYAPNSSSYYKDISKIYNNIKNQSETQGSKSSLSSNSDSSQKSNTKANKTQTMNKSDKKSTTKANKKSNKKNNKTRKNTNANLEEDEFFVASSNETQPAKQSSSLDALSPEALSPDSKEKALQKITSLIEKLNNDPKTKNDKKVKKAFEQYDILRSNSKSTKQKQKAFNELDKLIKDPALENGNYATFLTYVMYYYNRYSETVNIIYEKPDDMIPGSEKHREAVHAYAENQNKITRLLNLYSDPKTILPVIIRAKETLLKELKNPDLNIGTKIIIQKMLNKKWETKR